VSEEKMASNFSRRDLFLASNFSRRDLWLFKPKRLETIEKENIIIYSRISNY